MLLLATFWMLTFLKSRLFQGHFLRQPSTPSSPRRWDVASCNASLSSSFSWSRALMMLRSMAERGTKRETHESRQGNETHRGTPLSARVFSLDFLEVDFFLKVGWRNKTDEITNWFGLLMFKGGTFIGKPGPHKGKSLVFVVALLFQEWNSMKSCYTTTRWWFINKKMMDLL